MFVAIVPFEGQLSAQAASGPRLQVKKTAAVNPFQLDHVIRSFRAVAMDGTTFNTGSIKEKVVVLNFWFSRCAPCVKEMPVLNELVSRFERRSVGFYAFTTDKANEVNSFLQNREFRFTHIVDAKPLLDLLGVKAYPVTVILDQRGWIRYSQVNELPDVEELAKAIEAILG